MLRTQALASISLKRFHCQGGNVYCGLVKPRYIPKLTRAIVALQTISDYLDNLCDRAGVTDAAGFRQLHQAFTDAVDPESIPGDYYCLYPYRADGGYLRSLVAACRDALNGFPSYPAVKQEVLRLAELYSRLQVYKHLEQNIREPLVKHWLLPLCQRFPGFSWWEIAAATGSTLGIFTLMALATREKIDADEVHAVSRVYFPWIASLHILLDYFIDREEDRTSGDMNFTAYYPDLDQCRKRLKEIAGESLRLSAALPSASFHNLVVQGLLALYLSDPKVQQQGFAGLSREILESGGPGSQRLYHFCRLLRRIKIL